MGEVDDGFVATGFPNRTDAGSGNAEAVEGNRMKSRLLMSIGMVAATLGGMVAVEATCSLAVAAPMDRGGAQRAARFAATATALLGKHRRDPAVRSAEQAVEWAPHDARYRTLLGRTYLDAGRFASAAQAFTDALALDPTDGAAALNLALAQTALGDWVAARGTLFAHSARIAPADHGLALALAGDPAGGAAILSAVARGPDATATVRQNLALALALAGRWVEARKIAGIDLRPDAVDRRIVEWAAFVRPATAEAQVASLLGVSAVTDPGQPVALALIRPMVQLADAAPAAAALLPASQGEDDVAEPAVQPVPETVLAPAEPAAVAGITFAAPREIVQRLPGVYARPVATPASTTVASNASNASSRAVGTGQYYVQLGAYSDATAARGAWRQLGRAVPRLSALTPHGMAASVGGSRFYRLSVGGFDRAAAVALCSTVRTSGNKCFVRGHAGDQVATWVADTSRVAAR